MRDFSLSDAVWSGFRLIRREPAAVGLWCLMLFVLTVVPTVLMVGTMAPDVLSFFQSAIEQATPPNPAQMFPLIAKMQAWNGVAILTGLVSVGLLFAAVFRAVLRPEDRRFAYLRLGAAEFNQVVVVIVLYVLALIIVVPAMLLVMVPALVAGSAAPGAGVAFGLVLVVGLMALLVWLGLRMGMALPMTFDQGAIRLFESWRFTRGHAGRLFVMFLILVGLAIAIEVAIGGIVGGIVLSLVLQGSLDPDALKVFFSRPPPILVRELAPWILLLGLTGAVFRTLFSVIWLAPWAEAYRQIAAADAQAGPAFPSEDLDVKDPA